MKKYLYYPGCTLKTYATNLESSALAVARALDIELVELEKWYCCGAVAPLASDDLFHYLAPVRNFIAAQQESKDGRAKLVTLCDMCYNTLQHATILVKNNPKALETINSFLDTEEDYNGKVEVYHLLQILRDFVGFNRIKELVKKPLSNLRVACYYGCMLLRPRNISIDDPEEPQILDNIMSALGATVVPHCYPTECCGSYHIVDSKQIVTDKVAKIISGLRSKDENKDCDAIVVSCPLCRYNLETAQQPKNFKLLPVFYFTQLIALAFAIDEKYCGLEIHKIDPKPLLRNKNLI